MRKDAELNRQKILATARRLFEARGVAAVSMKDVAESAGIGPGTLYRHYAHKSTLCLALVTDRVQTFVTANMAYLQTTAADPHERFNVVVGRYLDVREANVELLTSVEAGEPGRAAFYQSDLYTGLARLFQTVIGDLKPELTAAQRRFQADMLIAMLKSTSYAFQRQYRQLSRAAILEQLCQLMS